MAWGEGGPGRGELEEEGAAGLVVVEASWSARSAKAWAAAACAMASAASSSARGWLRLTSAFSERQAEAMAAWRAWVAPSAAMSRALAARSGGRGVGSAEPPYAARTCVALYPDRVVRRPAPPASLTAMQ
jgi:hypothetical protein